MSEIRDRMQRRRKKRKILRVLILFAVIAVALLIFFNRDKLTPEALAGWLDKPISDNSGQSGFPVSLPSGKCTAMCSLGSDIGILGQSDIRFYSIRGKLLRNVQNTRKSAQSANAGDYMLVYSAGGNEYTVETPSKTAVSAKTENTIITGDICKNGRFAIATESDVYTSEMQVYDKNANAVFRWTPSGGSIISLGLSPDGYKVAAATVYTQGGKIMSGVYLFATGKSEALFSYTITDSIVTHIDCVSKGVKVITDNSVIWLNSDGEQVGKYDFGGKSLIKAVSNSENTVLLFKDSNDPQKSVLTALGSECKLKSETTVGYAVTDMAVSGNNGYLISKSIALEYEISTGVKTGEASSENEFENICSNSSGAFVINSASQLEKLEFNK